MAAKVASLRDGAMASTAAVSDARGMVRRAGTSVRAGGWTGSSRRAVPVYVEQHRLWHAALQQPWEVVPDRRRIDRAEPGKGHDMHSLWASVSIPWPSDMSAVVGASGPRARAEKAAGGQRRRAGQRARERERERESGGETRASASTTAETPESILLSAPGFAKKCAKDWSRMLAASAFSRTPCRVHGIRRTRARRGHGHFRRPPAASTCRPPACRGRRGRRSRGNSARSTGERTSRPPVDPPADSSRGCAARGHSPAAASYTNTSRTSASPSQEAWDAPTPRRPGLCSPSRPRRLKTACADAEQRRGYRRRRLGRRLYDSPFMLPVLVGHLPLYRRDLLLGEPVPKGSRLHGPCSDGLAELPRSCAD